MMQQESPMAYRRVAYLESSGTQYINTGIKPKIDSTKWEFSAQFTDTSGTQIMGCGLFAGHRFAFRLDSQVFSAAFGSNNYLNFGITANTDTVYNVVMSSYMPTNAQVNGTTITDQPASKYENYGIALFARYAGTYTYNCKCRLFMSKISQNGVLVQNLIPCIRKSDNKPGMYDTVSKTFYTNAGTGEFIVPA